MRNNGTMAIKGRLYPKSIFELAANPGLSIFEDLLEEFCLGIPNEPVTVVVVRPDMSDFQMTSTTDNEGFFEAQFNSDVVGEWSWNIWYKGREFWGNSYRCGEAYGEYDSVNVSPLAAGGDDGGE